MENIEFKYDLAKSKEIPPEEKDIMIDAWHALIVGDENLTADVEKLSIGELKEYFYDSLMSEINDIISDWGIAASQKIISKIETEINYEKKAKLELEFLEDCQRQVNDYMTNNKKPRSKWDSWPARFRETGQFNCVGSTLIGSALLDKAGIKNYHGIPVGHILNIVELSDGQFVYVDLINNIVEPINPEIIELNNVPVLKINESFSDYRLIIIRDKKEVIGSIFGNIDYLNTVAQDKNTAEDDYNKEEALKYYNKFKKFFDKTDFGKINTDYFLGHSDVGETEEMLKEAARINFIHGELNEAMKDIVSHLNKSESETLIKNIIKEINSLEKYLFSGDENLISSLDQNLQIFIKEYKRVLEKAKNKDVELFEDILRRFIEKFKK